MIEEAEFRRRSDEALTGLYNALAKASDDHPFEVDYGGALTIEFEEPKGKFVLSPNAPVRQIWLSAQSTSFKLDWSAGRGTFVLGATGQTLQELIEDVISRQLGTPIEL